MVIWKYEITPKDVVQLDIPTGAKFLDVQTQSGAPCAWLTPTREKSPALFVW